VRTDTLQRGNPGGGVDPSRYKSTCVPYLKHHQHICKSPSQSPRAIAETIILKDCSHPNTQPTRHNARRTSRRSLPARKRLNFRQELLHVDAHAPRREALEEAWPQVLQGHRAQRRRTVLHLLRDRL
jgi:hypothetical protein